MNFKIGMKLKGKISGIQPYGAFVLLNKKTQGLIHISEIQHGFIKEIEDVLEIGQEVAVEIMDIDEYSNKISLSMRSLSEEVPFHIQNKKIYFTNRMKKIGFTTLEKQMPIWIDEAYQTLTMKKN